jgi:hypothetical protein
MNSFKIFLNLWLLSFFSCVLIYKNGYIWGIEISSTIIYVALSSLVIFTLVIVLIYFKRGKDE